MDDDTRIHEYGDIKFVEDFGDAGAVGAAWHRGDRHIWIEGTADAARRVLFACPCGNNTTDEIGSCAPVSLDVQRGGGKGWLIEFHDDGTLSLSPSILTKKKADEEHIHIFLKHNKVQWC